MMILVDFCPAASGRLTPSTPPLIIAYLFTAMAVLSGSVNYAGILLDMLHLHTPPLALYAGGTLLATLGASGINSSLTVNGVLDFATGGTSPKVSLVGITGFSPNAAGSWTLATTTTGVTVGGSAPGTAFSSYSINGGSTGPVTIDVSNLGYTLPNNDATFTVTYCGRICFHGRKINLSHVLAGQDVGVTQVGERIWLVTFMQYDLGYFDDEVGRLEPIANPFGSKVLPMCSE